MPSRPLADYHRSILEDENTQRLLKIFIALVLGGSLLYLAALPFSSESTALRGTGVFVVDLCALGALWCLRRGRMDAAVTLLIWGVWAAILLQAGIANGLKSRTLMAMPIIIVLAGWLLPARGAILLCLATVIAGLGLAQAEQAGLLPLVVSPSPPHLAWLAFSIYVLLAAAVAYHIFRGFRLRHEALAAREAELDLLMENVPAMIFHGDRGKRCIYANRAYVEFHDPGGPQPVGRTVREIVGEEAYEGVDARLDRVLAGERLDYRTMRRSRNGDWRALDIELLPETVGNGTVKGFFAVISDVTDRVHAEDELHRSELKFASAFRSSPLAVAITRLEDGRYLDVNEAFLRLFGWRREEAVGRTSLELGKWTAPEARTGWAAALKRDGRVTNLETAFRTRSGEIRQVLLSAELIDIAGETCALVMTADITDQMQAKQEIHRLNAELEQRVQERTAELTAANRELESFAYSISHDLRAPLRGIDGFSHLLAEEYAERLDEQGRGYLARVRSAAQRMGTLIDDILELSRVTRVQMVRQRVDLGRLAEDVLAELRQANPGRAVETRIAEGVAMLGDPQLLRILMQNLVENAWKYTGRREHPRIEFGTEARDGAAWMFVRDNGAGFDMRYADRIFTPFQRLHKPTEFEGTGIGLATVARIVHRHGGRVEAEGTVDSGACFRFTLGRP